PPPQPLRPQPAAWMSPPGELVPAMGIRKRAGDRPMIATKATADQDVTPRLSTEGTRECRHSWSACGYRGSGFGSSAIGCVGEPGWGGVAPPSGRDTNPATG